jgi:hypothetical protein
MKELQKSAAAAKRRNSSDAARLEKDLNDRRTALAKYYKLTPQDMQSAYEYASAAAGGAGSAGGAGAPKAGKFLGFE